MSPAPPNVRIYFAEITSLSGCKKGASFANSLWACLR